MEGVLVRNQQVSAAPHLQCPVLVNAHREYCHMPGSPYIMRGFSDSWHRYVKQLWIQTLYWPSKAQQSALWLGWLGLQQNSQFVLIGCDFTTRSVNKIKMKHFFKMNLVTRSFFTLFCSMQVLKGADLTLQAYCELHHIKPL